MGARINIILADGDQVAAVLVADSCHSEVDVEHIVRTHSVAANSLNELLSWLMKMTYPTTVGPNTKGSPVFTLDTGHGNHSKLLLVSPCELDGMVCLTVEDLGEVSFEAKLLIPCRGGK